LKPRRIHQASLLTDSAEAFGDLVDPYRSELLVHCYRMLGTIDEAEDAVQDALARAWQGRQTYRRSISFRAWLYRIATNACLNAIERRKRDRVESNYSVGPGPDRLLAGIAPSEAGPEARYDARESVSLAFLTVLQLLPPRQRAVLLLRDVLSLRAIEVAALLDMSVPAVNSALQRARTTLRRRYRPAKPSPAAGTLDRGMMRTLLGRYVRAWEASDVAGLVALLCEDAILRMPPMPMVSGAQPIGDFLAGSIFSSASMRLFETDANGSPAFAAYAHGQEGGQFVPFALLVLDIDGRRIAAIDAFRDTRLFGSFGLPLALPG
jgi:RNA polymerase sigma-70 factor (ECF subfamily)